MIRDMIQGWFFPEHEVLQRKYQDLTNRVSEARWWLSEFPDISRTARWIEASHAKYCGRNVEAVEGKPWINSIAEFRDYIRGLQPQVVNKEYNAS